MASGSAARGRGWVGARVVWVVHDNRSAAPIRDWPSRACNRFSGVTWRRPKARHTNFGGGAMSRLGPPQGAGWVANAIWGRITPCCFGCTRSNESPLIHSAGPVCGIQGRCLTRASLSAGPTGICTHQVSLYPSATAPGTEGDIQLRLDHSASDHFACIHQGLGNPGNRTIQQTNYLPGTHAPIPGDPGSWSRPVCQRDSRRSRGILESAGVSKG